MASQTVVKLQQEFMHCPHLSPRFVMNPIIWGGRGWWGGGGCQGVGWRWLLRDTHVEVETLKALMVAHSCDPKFGTKHPGLGWENCYRQTVSDGKIEFLWFVFFPEGWISGLSFFFGGGQ